jgi:hypothetical protein
MVLETAHNTELLCIFFQLYSLLYSDSLFSKDSPWGYKVVQVKEEQGPQRGTNSLSESNLEHFYLCDTIFFPKGLSYLLQIIFSNNLVNKDR